MTLRLITAATTYPVDIDEVKLACRFDSSALDAEIETMIDDCTRLTEHENNQCLMTQTFEYSCDAFPAKFELTRNPVQSVTSITYVDGTGATVTLAEDQYTLINDGFGFARITPAYGVVWPSVRGDIDGVKVRFVAGYASAALVPGNFKRQVKIFVSMLIEDPHSLDERMGAIGKVWS